MNALMHYNICMIHIIRHASLWKRRFPVPKPLQHCCWWCCIFSWCSLFSCVNLLDKCVSTLTDFFGTFSSAPELFCCSRLLSLSGLSSFLKLMLDWDVKLISEAYLSLWVAFVRNVYSHPLLPPKLSDIVRSNWSLSHIIEPNISAGSRRGNTAPAEFDLDSNKHQEISKYWQFQFQQVEI